MKIDCTLNTTSLLAAAKQLRDYANSLEQKTDTLVKTLGENCAEYARVNLKHIDTGETLDSITYTHERGKGVVSAGGAAVWIEFGTGVVKNTGLIHPAAQEIGMSAWGTYGGGNGANPHGWWYPKTEIDTETGETSEKYRHTYGIEMNPFMWNAAQQTRDELQRTAEGVFEND